MQSKANKWPPFGSGGWILIPNVTPDETPPGFHLRWNMFFISEIKHFHFNEIFIDYTTHGNNAIYHCFIWENMSLHNFLLFHLRRHVKNSGFVLHHGFQTPRNRWKHSPSFLTYYINTSLGQLVHFSFFLSVGDGGSTYLRLGTY